MQTVLIVIHLMIVLALVAVVLLQRSEGGGLGIGGGGGGNMMASRASANPLTRITGFLALAFFITSLSLGILARYEAGPSSILDQIETETEGTGEGILDQLGGSDAPAPATAPEGGANVPSAAPETGTDTAPAADVPPVEDSAPQSDDSGDIPTGQ